MKIATFNINNVNKRPSQSAGLAARGQARRGRARQELKAADARISRQAAIEKAGYGAAWRGQKSWNGVAILARGCEPVVTRRATGRSGRQAKPLYRGCGQRRAHHLALRAERQSAAGAEIRLQARLDGAALRACRGALCHRRAGRAGRRLQCRADRSRHLSDEVLRQETRWCSRKPRALFPRILEQGWVDAIRTLHPDAPMYTFWDYMRNRWPRDAGLRIDHLLLSAEAAKRLVDAGVDREVRGKTARAIMPRPGSCCEMQRRSTKSPAATQRPRRADQATRDGKADARPPAAGDRRRFFRAPLLSRAAENDPAARRKPAGAILGFANLLLRLYRDGAAARGAGRLGHARGADLSAREFPAYQSGREFDDALLEQLDALPEFVARLRLCQCQGRRLRGRRFSVAAAVAAEERRGGTALVASGDRDTFQLASERPRSCIRCARARWRASVRPRCASAMASIRSRCRISSRCAATLRQAAGRTRRGRRGRGSAPAEVRFAWRALKAGRFAGAGGKACGCSARSPPWTARRRCRACGHRKPTWDKAPRWRAAWELNQLAQRLDELANSAAARAGR